MPHATCSTPPLIDLLTSEDLAPPTLLAAPLLEYTSLRADPARDACSSSPALAPLDTSASVKPPPDHLAVSDARGTGRAATAPRLSPPLSPPVASHPSPRSSHDCSHDERGDADASSPTRSPSLDRHALTDIDALIDLLTAPNARGLGHAATPASATASAPPHACSSSSLPPCASARAEEGGGSLASQTRPLTSDIDSVFYPPHHPAAYVSLALRTFSAGPGSTPSDCSSPSACPTHAPALPSNGAPHSSISSPAHPAVYVSLTLVKNSQALTRPHSSPPAATASPQAPLPPATVSAKVPADVSPTSPSTPACTRDPDCGEGARGTLDVSVAAAIVHVSVPTTQHDQSSVTGSAGRGADTSPGLASECVSTDALPCHAPSTSSPSRTPLDRLSAAREADLASIQACIRLTDALLAQDLQAIITIQAHVSRRLRRWSRRRLETSLATHAVTTIPSSPPETDFIIYLCCGRRRPGDFGEQCRWRGVPCVMIDVRIDPSHDLTRPSSVDALASLARSPWCLGVIATTPCSTFAAARFEPLPAGRKGPPVVRTFPDHVAGVPDADGLPPLHVLLSNVLIVNVLYVMGCASLHGGANMFENPPPRRRGVTFNKQSLHIPGRERRRPQAAGRRGARSRLVEASWGPRAPTMLPPSVAGVATTDEAQDYVDADLRKIHVLSQIPRGPI